MEELLKSPWYLVHALVWTLFGWGIAKMRFDSKLKAVRTHDKMLTMNLAATNKMFIR